ncbi:MAG: two-component system, LytTR family, response regulator [Thermoanaerobaculia bacterium]|jgi:two-component system LytT family response regulator|nr:two-component system, LytTR family, response regulator [Thermoanaerobaculia bacterium]
MRDRLRVIVADDERPARSLLLSMLRRFHDVEIVGEATDGAAAVELIEREKPDLALLDLQMPEVDGIGVVRLIKRGLMPMIAFVTAYDEYAVRAFELNAVDYLLKPVDAARLRETVSRAIDRLDRDDARAAAVKNVRTAASAFEATSAGPLRRIPVRRKNEIVLVPVNEVASVIADGELLHLTTIRGVKHTISYRLKDLEARLDREEFIRLSRGTLANINTITKATPMPGGTFVLLLSNGQELQTSRFHSRLLRERLLRL